MAKKKGIYRGRKKGTTEALALRAQKLRKQGLTIPEVANALAVSDRTMFLDLSESSPPHQ